MTSNLLRILSRTSRLSMRNTYPVLMSTIPTLTSGVWTSSSPYNAHKSQRANANTPSVWKPCIVGKTSTSSTKHKNSWWLPPTRFPSTLCAGWVAKALTVPRFKRNTIAMCSPWTRPFLSSMSSSWTCMHNYQRLWTRRAIPMSTLKMMTKRNC